MNDRTSATLFSSLNIVSCDFSFLNSTIYIWIWMELFTFVHTLRMIIHIFELRKRRYLLTFSTILK